MRGPGRLRRLPRSLWKFAVFAAACLVLLALLAIHLGNLSPFASRTTYLAQLSAVTGLGTGTPVDVAGVPVGQVSSIVVQRGHALVGIAVQPTVVLRPGTDVGLRWRNVIGQKDVYLYPAGAGSPLRPGATIPLSHDVTDASVNAFLDSIGPFLEAINPQEANAFVEAVSGAIDGDTAKIDQLIDNGAAIAQTVGQLDTQVGQVIDNLDQVLSAIADHSGDVATLVDNLQAVSASLATHNTLLDSVVTNLSTVAGDLATLIGQNRGTLDATIDDLDTVTATIEANQSQLTATLSTLGSGLAPYVEISSYGQWFQVQTVYNCLAGQAACTYDAPTHPPAGSGPLGGAPLATPAGSPSSSPGAASSGPSAAGSGAGSSAGGGTGGTATGGPSSVTAILRTVAGLAGGGG